MPRNIQELVNSQILRAQIVAKENAENGEGIERPVVTISRGMGSGARIIAEKLAKDLGWTLWSKELLDAVANDAQVSRSVVEAFDEKTISEVELLIHDLLGDHERGSFLYIRHLIAVVSCIAKAGNAIILGRGANFIVPNALKVRIDAPEELRVQNMMDFENLSEPEAQSRIRRSDRERRAFLIKYFGKDNVGHCVYDVCLCMCTFTNDQATEILDLAIRSKFKIKRGATRRPQATENCSLEELRR